jgi:ATP-dependent DNA ligase
MSDLLQNYVLENYSKVVKTDLSTWLLQNPLPSICEPKLDGIRVFLFKSGDKLVISSKHGEIFTPKGSPKVFATVPEFVHAPHRMILDGEYVSDRGLFLFDVLQIDDRAVKLLTLDQRKKVLREILEGTNLEVPYTRTRSVEEVFSLKKELIREGGEGIIVKNPASTYGQTNAWLKLKRYDTVDCFVVDYEETPDMKRTGVPRSWFVGVYDENGGRVNLGKVGGFVEKVDPRRVTIGSVIEVRFHEVTEEMKLREPFIVRIRHDKTPSECLLSQLTK